jgi:anti-sigma B factor antagonist
MTVLARSQQRPTPFRVDVEPDRDAVRVVPAGELDLAGAGELETQLRELREAGFRRIVLDLRGLEFLDSTGIRLILDEDLLARSNGHAFTLISGPPAIQRALAVCGVLEHLRFDTP